MSQSSWHEELLQNLIVRCGRPKEFICKREVVEVEYPGAIFLVPYEANIDDAVNEVLMHNDEGGESIH